MPDSDVRGGLENDRPADGGRRPWVGGAGRIWRGEKRDFCPRFTDGGTRLDCGANMCWRYFGGRLLARREEWWMVGWCVWRERER